MKHDLFELSVAVPSKSGSTKIPEYGHQGLTLVEGRRGQPFLLKLRNDSAQRVLAVISIDGLGIVDGEPCTEKSKGYVIPAYSAVEIEGWRNSLTEVHKFTFEGKTNDPGTQPYAKSVTGSVENCGVIAAKFFSEKWKPAPAPAIQRIVEEHHHHHYPRPVPLRPWPYPSWPEVWYTCNAGDNSGLAGTHVSHEGPISVNYCASMNSPGVSTRSVDASEVPEFTLGTGWGEAKHSVVTEVDFERDRELCTLTIYYAEALNLEKVGITMRKDVAVTRPASPAVLPQAFAGFCKPPAKC